MAIKLRVKCYNCQAETTFEKGSVRIFYDGCPQCTMRYGYQADAEFRVVDDSLDAQKIREIIREELRAARIQPGK